jgi:hypothetical protein
LNEAAGSTSRRAFLGRAAGAAAVVAGAGVGAGAIASSAAAADQRAYTAGRFALSLDGASVGNFPGLDGGNPANAVVREPIGSDRIVRKHTGQSTYEPCTIQVGSGMSMSTYQWMSDVIVRGWDPKTKRRASVIGVGSHGEEAFRRSFADALITEITFPALDVSSSKVAQIAVTFTSQQVTDRKPSGLPVVAAKQKAWMCANFRLKIDGIDLPGARVAKIDSFTWKCGIQDDGSLGLDMGDITIHCDNANLPDFQLWLANLQKGVADERNGTLTLAGGGGVLTLGLYNLGVYAVRPDNAPGQLRSGRFAAEMYCESATWDIKKNV